ncbi:MAG: exo-alpha-sialidase [Armatimonadetes bacterium]|nr:exo-alpha-sialidase [Armatimonadota bacterium]MDE2205797.1 exo-alpha-sialidase [Armatimonadota bacterium]
MNVTGEQNLTIERIAGPETDEQAYKHPATIAELQNGDLLAAWYGGAAEYAVNTSVFISRRNAGETVWSAPAIAAHDPFRSAGNGVIWQQPGGPVWLFYVVRWGATWSTSRIQAKVSHDGARSWSDSFVVSDVPGTLVRGRPLQLANGSILLPIYRETGDDIEMVPPESCSCFLIRAPHSSDWSPAGEIHSRKGNIQPAVVQLQDGRLLAWCRRAGGYGHVTDGYIVASQSLDSGATWSAGLDTTFPNPNAAVDLLRLTSGRLLLVFNDSMNERTPLTAAISADDGTTWPFRRNIATGPYDYAYPYAIQGRAGAVHLIYTSHSRTVVNHATFSESWVMQAPPV